MTREDAINMLYGIRADNLNLDDAYTKDKYDALSMAIKALEQEPILDKIRAEIERQREKVSEKHSDNEELQAYYNGLNDGLKDARDICDKYKAESEST